MSDLQAEVTPPATLECEATGNSTLEAKASDFDPAFETTWQTTSADEDVQLPLVSSGTYDFTVYWGDGATDEITAYNDAAATHTFASAGEKRVRIEGTITGFNFGDVAHSAAKIYDVRQWGPLVIADQQAFDGCTNLDVSAFDAPAITAARLSLMFDDCDLSVANGFEHWDVSGVDYFHLMFNGTLFNGNVSGWDVGNATVFSYMFNGPLFNQPLNDWDMSSATTTFRMFWNNFAFNQPLDNWDTSALTNAGQMFRSATAFNQDLSSWDTSLVTDMSFMFDGASVFNQDLSSWDVTSLTDAEDMLQGTALTTTNYDALLNGWAAQSVQSGVVFGAGTTQYSSAGETARDTLVNTHGWTITDGGLA